MADPIRQKIIGVKIPDASIGEYCKVVNLTSGGQFYAKIGGTDRSVVINPNEDFTWSNGDTVQAEIHGRINGQAKSIIQSGGIMFTISGLSADTTTPGADL